MSEKPWNPTENREKTIQLAFEKCTIFPLPQSLFCQTHYHSFWSVNVPSFAFASDASLTMFAAGKTTGLSVNCGHDVMSATPVYEGMSPSSSPLRPNVDHPRKDMRWSIQPAMERLEGVN